MRMLTLAFSSKLCCALQSCLHGCRLLVIKAAVSIVVVVANALCS